jgi:hypothetical protein
VTVLDTLGPSTGRLSAGALEQRSEQFDQRSRVRRVISLLGFPAISVWELTRRAFAILSIYFSDRFFNFKMSFLDNLGEAYKEHHIINDFIFPGYTQPDVTVGC